MRRRDFWRGVLSAVVVLAGGAAAWGEEVAAPVTVLRPYLPGKRYAVTASYEHTTTIVGGVVDRTATLDKTENVHYGLTGTISDAKLDETRKLVSYRLAIDHMTREGRDAIKPGTVVLIDHRERTKAITAVDGSAVPDNAKPLFTYLLYQLNFNHPLVDAAMGSKTARKIGDSWAIEAKSAVDLLEDQGQVPAANVSGNMTLKEGTGGMSGRRLAFDLTYIDLYTKNLPKEVFLERSLVVFKGTVLMPEDPKVPLREIDCSADGEAGFTTARNSVKARAKFHIAWKQTTVPLEEKAAASGPAAQRK